jgi:hypothetical protein
MPADHYNHLTLETSPRQAARKALKGSICPLLGCLCHLQQQSKRSSSSNTLGQAGGDPALAPSYAASQVSHTTI